MQRKEAMDFIYDLVEKRGGIDNVRREIEKEKATEPRKQLIFLFFSSWWINMNCLNWKNVQNTSEFLLIYELICNVSSKYKKEKAIGLLCWSILLKH